MCATGYVCLTKAEKHIIAALAESDCELPVEDLVFILSETL